MNRRIFLISSATAGLAAVGAASSFAFTRTPQRALQPWDQAGLDRKDPRVAIVEHAILAPNPHNRQPWILELSGVSEMILTCDLDRRLPQTDPFDRQIVIGLGAFTELAVIAASALGYRLDVAAFPEGEPGPRLDKRPIARFRLERDASLPVDPLFAQIKRRRSTKAPFDNARAVPAGAIAALADAGAGNVRIGVIDESARVSALRRLTHEAWLIEATTRRTFMESVELMRIGKAEIEANPDGIALGGGMMDTLALLGQVTRGKLADPQSSAFAQGLEKYRVMLDATPAYLTLITEGVGRLPELNAGRRYVRANLLATGMGLAMQPVSQALQEFPEMAEKRAEVEREAGVEAPRRLQMLARIGYGPAAPPAPRWAAATRIRSA
jgi:hypothetical protein